jgi:SAM-dependent methyltransferase
MSQENQPIDTTTAEAYERHMVPGMFAHWTELVVGLVPPQPTDHVLDIACGTGIGVRVASRFVGSTGKVVGVDIDPGVIEVARRLTQATGIPMEWHCADALQVPFKDATFDLCFCLQGLQFFPDRHAGLAEIRRILKPSGRLAASIWGPLEYNMGHYAVVQALESQGVDASAAKRACSFSNPDDIRDAATRAGFSRMQLHTEDGVSHFTSIKSFIDGMTQGSPSTRHAVALLPEGGRDEFLKHVTMMLGPYVTSGELSYPMRTHVLVAQP